MKFARKGDLLLIVVAMLTALPGRADFARKTQWILATAKATGAGGEQFISSLRITNEFNVNANVTLTYFAQSPLDSSFTAGGDNTNAPNTTISVGPGSTVAVEDVLGTLFASQIAPFGVPAGGFRIDSDVPVSVISRTFVANGRSATGAPGIYGFSIPGEPGGVRVFVGDTAVVSYISASPTRLTGFRSNFIMLNTGSAVTVLNVQLLRGDGSVIGARNYTLYPYGSAQQGDIANSLGYSGPDTDLFLWVTVASGSPVLLGASVIDNAISSLNYVPSNKVTGFPNNGAFATIFTDDYRTYGGRLEVFGGVPTYFATAVNLYNCASSSNQFFVGAIGQGYSGANTTFSNVDAYTFSFTGGDSSGTWSGTVVSNWIGVPSGTLTFIPASGPCNGVSQTYNWLGSGELTSVPN